MRRLPASLALAAALLYAQLAIAVHGASHLADVDHDAGKVCVECLALAGAAPLPVSQAATAGPPEAAHVSFHAGVLPRLSFADAVWFLTRAPPLVLC